MTLRDIMQDSESTTVSPPRALKPFIKGLRFGQLLVQLPGGRVLTFRGRDPGPNAVVTLHRWRTIRRIMLGGSIAFGEAYVDGDWDSPDLVPVIELFARNIELVDQAVETRSPFRLGHRLLHRFRRNTPRGSRRNVAAHYDIGNTFYETWLDSTMTYSSALYGPDDIDLGAAQERKYAALAKAMRLGAGQRLLEIGCGWGGFSVYAARNFGCKVTALTLSKEQLSFAQRRIAQEGLDDQIELRLQDYREVSGTFDRIASIEMFEAVGEEHWPAFFQIIRKRLAPGGVAGMQVIRIADSRFAQYRRNADFIQRYIFPGGMLPSPLTFDKAASGAGLSIDSEKTFGIDYARTLADWHARFLEAWPAIEVLGYDQKFKRLWKYYLAYCEAGFRSGITDVAQLTLSPSGP